MKVFLTGGSGYLGRATIAALTRHGHQVSSLARSDSASGVVTSLGASAVRGDLTDVDVLHSAAASADAVVHLGQAHDGDIPGVDRAAADALQDGLGDRGPYVHTGGLWVYGNTDGIADEDSPQLPPPITAWRRSNEKTVLARGGRLVMPGVVYGHGGGLIDAFLTTPGRTEGAVPRIGDGAHHWALVHVDDIAELYVLALEAKPGTTYAGVTQNLPMADVAEAVSHAAGCPGRITSLTAAEAAERMGPFAEAFSLDQRITADRARRELGWHPSHTDALADLRTS